jgi:hypothetical protein
MRIAIALLLSSTAFADVTLPRTAVLLDGELETRPPKEPEKVATVLGSELSVNGGAWQTNDGNAAMRAMPLVIVKDVEEPVQAMDAIGFIDSTLPIAEARGGRTVVKRPANKIKKGAK